MNTFKLTNKFVIIFYAVLVSLFYYQSFFTYFQGDEWYYFIQFLPYTHSWTGIFHALYKSIADTGVVSGGGHVTPIYNGVWFLYNQLFGLNYLPYIISAIALHIVNVILLFFTAENLTQNRRLAFLAGLFYGISAAHFQAITWVMAFIPTELAVTFLLLSLYTLTRPTEPGKISARNSTYKWIFLFALMALLTKETIVILFALIPLVLFLTQRKSLTKIFYRYYFGLLLFYGAFRFGVPVLFEKFSHQVVPAAPQAVELSLYVYRAFTYPLKTLVLSFIPWRWILNAAEFITPLAYPTYGAEKEVRGINFLTFTQGAGSELFIYPLSLLLIFAAVYGLKKTYLQKDRNPAFNVIVFGAAIIVLSTFPLLLISTYAPWWGFVTFIDSRHLYVPSIGAALLFAYFSDYLADKLNGIFKKYGRGGNKVAILFFIVLIWGVLQFSALYKEMTLYTEMGTQRKALLKTLIGDIPTLPKKSAILIVSDTGYYGFGPIPPFQTNFGQVLSVIYYDRNQLPKEFMQSDFLSKNSLTGEGYKEIGERGFGYFITEETALRTAIDTNLPAESIFAFTWNGKTNTLTNISPEIRSKLDKTKSALGKYSEWQKVTMEEVKLSVRAPSGAIITKSPPASPNALATVRIDHGLSHWEVTAWKKVFNIGIYEDISMMNNSDGIVIDKDFYYRNINPVIGAPITAKVTTTGKSMKYFIPTLVPNTIIEVTAVGVPSELNKEDKNTEEIISLLRYPDSSN